MKRHLTIFFLLLAGWTNAQNFSQLGRYSIPFKKACAPVTIHVQVEDTLGNVPRTYIYEEGLSDVSATSYTFSAPGTYSIVQLSGANVKVKTDTLRLEVVESQVPEFEVFNCSLTEIRIDITDTYYDYYVVVFSGTDTAVVTSGNPGVSYDYGASSGNFHIFGRFNDGYPNCSDVYAAFSITPPSPATINSSNIVEGCKNEYYIELNLEYDSLSQYRIDLRQGNSNYSTLYNGKIPDKNLIFPISYDQSAQNYCLRVSLLNACTQTEISATESCYSPDVVKSRPLDSAYASYNTGGNIEIKINELENHEIAVLRRYGSDGDFGALKTTLGPFTDETGTHYRPFHYKLIQQDSCGQALDSAIIAAPFLKIIDKRHQSNEVTFSISEPVNPFNTPNHTLVVYNRDSSAAIEISYQQTITLPAGLGSKLNMVSKYFYPDLNLAIYSNQVSTSYEPMVFIPGAFTPNNDGLNDHLKLFGLPTQNYEISIYNRWGELIHEAKDTNPVWDGHIGQKNAPEGTYRYKLIFFLPDGSLKTQVGTFVVLNQ